MKRRHKLELLLGDIRTLLTGPVENPRDYALAQAVWGLAFFRERLSRDAAAMRAVLEVACLLRASARSGRQVAEEKLMDHLRSLAWECGGRLHDAKLKRLAGFSGIIQVSPELQARRSGAPGIARFRADLLRVQAASRFLRRAEARPGFRHSGRSWPVC